MLDCLGNYQPELDAHVAVSHTLLQRSNFTIEQAHVKKLKPGFKHI